MSSASPPRLLSRFVLGSVFFFLSYLLVRRTFLRGDDFEVFWKISRAFLADGTSPYSVDVYGRMVFKYPPWIMPAFLPFALVPLAAAKLAWGLVEVASLALVVRSLRSTGAREWIQALVLAIFGGMIGLHGLVGQITLPLLALALWAAERVDSSGEPRTGPQIAVAYAFSSKVLTVLPLFEVFRLPNWRRILGGSLGLAGLLTLPLLIRSYGFSFSALVADWEHAMFSGTRVSEDQFIGFNTREAQGLTGLVLRVFSLDQTDSSLVLAVTLGSFALVALVYGFVSRGWKREDRLYGWLALTPVVQPLAWLHFFLLAYPLIALGLERAWRLRRFAIFAGLGAAALLVGAVTEKTMGQAGLALEMLSIKSWGALLAVGLFARVRGLEAAT